MKNCPQCGKPRQGETFKCPVCQVFYSQIDEILYEEQQLLERRSLSGRLKNVWAAADRQAALKQLRADLWRETPLKTKITLLTIFAFVFALIVSVL